MALLMHEYPMTATSFDRLAGAPTSILGLDAPVHLDRDTARIRIVIL
jgi:hypothetical protein